MIILAIVSAGTIVGPIAIWILSIALGDYFAYKYNQRLLAQTNFMKDVVDTVGKTDDKQEGINDIESETIISEDEDEFKIVFQAKDSNSWKNIKTKLMLFYAKHDISMIVSDTEVSWMIKGKDNREGYVRANLNGNKIMIGSVIKVL